MSNVIKWNSPDQYENISNDGARVDVRQVEILKEINGLPPLVSVAIINATSDGNAIGTNNNFWINEYEDLTGNLGDVYQIRFYDSLGRKSQLSAPGQGGYMDRLHQIMDLIRYDLADDDATFYQLDKVPQYRWTGTQIAAWLTSALNEFNGTGKMLTSYTFQTLPADAIPVIEEGVIFRAFRARQSKEVPNVLDYNDGVSFKILNRVQDYRGLAQDSLARFKELVLNWKMTHRPKAIGLGSQRLPFRITRPLSMLPNMQNVFGF
jgi:hypothetical protein